MRVLVSFLAIVYYSDDDFVKGEVNADPYIGHANAD